MIDDNFTENVPIDDNNNYIDKEDEIIYDTSKDFYKGIRGELRFKAEGLFKKAKEKGISIEDIEVSLIKENSVDIPGVGNVELPTYFVKVKGIVLENQRTIVDGKQISFYNRYQKYFIEKIKEKNYARDVQGKIIYSNNRPLIKQDNEFSLSDWEKFEIGRLIIEEKEFGLEKTITGACDRVIRKLMGENDWLYPGEAKLLEEEFNEVDRKVFESEVQKANELPKKKASEKQIKFFKGKIKNRGLDSEDNVIIKKIMLKAGFEDMALEELTTMEMSKLINIADDIIANMEITH